jgi:hypothetical protein
MPWISFLTQFAANFPTVPAPLELKKAAAAGDFRWLHGDPAAGAKKGSCSFSVLAYGE